MNHWESIVNIAHVATRWSLIISTSICTKVETKRVHTGFPCCIPFVDPVITALSLARSNVGNYNHHGLELNSETKQTKEQREHIFGFLRFNEAKERRNLFGFLQTKR